MAQKNSFLTVASIMSIFFIAMGVGTITPALNSIMMAFPDLPISTIYLTSTLPSLMVIPSTIIAGMVAGSKVKFKTLATIGIILFVVAGVAPAFATDNFTLILIERAVFGIGLGIISPIGNALILGLYEGDTRAKLLGMGTVMMNVGGIILQFLGGFMAGIAWNYAFYPHALGILSLILVIFFLPEPESIEHPEGIEKPKATIPGKVWLVSILFGALMFVTYPLLMGMSSFLVLKELGDATVAAVVLSFFTVGGMIAGAIFSTVFKVAKRFTIAVALLTLALGFVLVLYTGSFILVTIGTALVGVGFSLLMPAVFMIVGMLADPPSIPICSSVVLAVMNAFAFVSTYWIQMIGNITGDPLVMPMVVGMIMAAVAGVIFLFVDPFPKMDAPPPPLE
ncbi:MFS transporter [Eubacteriaceae bacterium ES2]|nr:MFS transporter [Eubacteriaceae bacterium ES2]